MAHTDPLEWSLKLTYSGIPINFLQSLFHNTLKQRQTEAFKKNLTQKIDFLKRTKQKPKKTIEDAKITGQKSEFP